MGSKTRALAGVAGSSLMLIGMGTGAATALANETENNIAPQEAAIELDNQGGACEVPYVKGVFSFAQNMVTPLDEIAKNLATASHHLCGANLMETGDIAAEDWTISVGGAVDNPYKITIAELREDSSAQSVIMGCTCAANPVDGRASVNAEVTGVAVMALLDKAGAIEDANTIVFTSSDGYKVELPLHYVTQRYCPIVFDVNGSPIAKSVGGANQLWLGSTSAKYFARNIVSISLEVRDILPEAPSANDAGDNANLPNVGIYFGGVVQ